MGITAANGKKIAVGPFLNTHDDFPRNKAYRTTIDSPVVGSTKRFSVIVCRSNRANGQWPPNNWRTSSKTLTEIYMQTLNKKAEYWFKTLCFTMDARDRNRDFGSPPEAMFELDDTWEVVEEFRVWLTGSPASPTATAWPNIIIVSRSSRKSGRHEDIFI